ncbi:unnamed protein product [Rhizoctonia solani]|uniref:DEAD/DEAH box helicase domain-containing protein n=1 Tax=Rhizoctonia solani TaxID=456999 RepID=A0A8H2WGT7_9AGAM|nr:unnamed protein product [Rhizoctonia solani]
MPKSSRGGKSKERELKEAVKALSAAAKSLALASDALSRLYDADEDDASTPEIDIDSNSAKSKVHRSPRPVAKPTIDYEDSDDEYMTLAREVISAATTAMGKVPGRSPTEENKAIWSETQNNFGTFETPSKGDAESENGHRPSSSVFQPPSGLYYGTPPTVGSQTFSDDVTSGNPSKSYGDSIPPPTPKTWASLVRLNSEKWGISASTPAARENFDSDSQGGKANDDPKQDTREPLANLKNRWATPTDLQRRILRPLLAGSDMLLLHSNLKSHVHAILAHCALVIVPQQTTGRLYLQYANELLSDFDLPHKAMLLPGGGSDVAIESERMSTEKIDILISSPRVFVNHVNSNPNLVNHLTRIRFVIYAGAHELTKTDIFLSFQFNMIKKRMPTRAKSPRQIIIAAAHMDEHIQVFASRGLQPGYTTIYGAKSDDNTQSESWDSLLKP